MSCEVSQVSTGLGFRSSRRFGKERHTRRRKGSNESREEKRVGSSRIKKNHSPIGSISGSATISSWVVAIRGHFCSNIFYSCKRCICDLMFMIRYISPQGENMETVNSTKTKHK